MRHAGRGRPADSQPGAMAGLGAVRAAYSPDPANVRRFGVLGADSTGVDANPRRQPATARAQQQWRMADDAAEPGRQMVLPAYVWFPAGASWRCIAPEFIDGFGGFRQRAHRPGDSAFRWRGAGTGVASAVSGRGPPVLQPGIRQADRATNPR